MCESPDGGIPALIVAPVVTATLAVDADGTAAILPHTLYWRLGAAIHNPTLH
ncbi:MAG TPA: hypothetical protein VKE53_01860 [Pseudolabrys sp.]|jgi:hypothetical protein|nr:hypothetical protein [Pseudolabrys sp.]